MSYNRLGRQDTISDAVGTRTFAYRTADPDPIDLQLKSETINGSGGGLYGKTITRKYEDGTNSTVAGRYMGLYFGTNEQTSEYKVTYAYERRRAGRSDPPSSPGAKR